MTSNKIAIRFHCKFIPGDKPAVPRQYLILLVFLKLHSMTMFWSVRHANTQIQIRKYNYNYNWVDWTDLVHLIFWRNGSCSFDWLIDWLTDWMNPIYHIWRCMPNILNLMVANFMRCYTSIKISLGCWFHEILHQNQNISWLQISWNITPGSKYQWLQI